MTDISSVLPARSILMRRGCAASARRRASAIALDSNPVRVGASATAFLLAIGAHEDAERLMARHFDDLTCAYYTHLLRLAEAAAEACQPRVEVLCYRRLMLGVLEAGRSKIYRHATRYLAPLERLDGEAGNGQGVKKGPRLALPGSLEAKALPQRVAAAPRRARRARGSSPSAADPRGRSARRSTCPTSQGRVLA
jgi:hypothetical protein